LRFYLAGLCGEDIAWCLFLAARGEEDTSGAIAGLDEKEDGWRVSAQQQIFN
jgi:hypothetical protein